MLSWLWFNTERSYAGPLAQSSTGDNIVVIALKG